MRYGEKLIRECLEQEEADVFFTKWSTIAQFMSEPLVPLSGTAASGQESLAASEPTSSEPVQAAAAGGKMASPSRQRRKCGRKRKATGTAAGGDSDVPSGGDDAPATTLTTPLPSWPESVQIAPAGSPKKLEPSALDVGEIPLPPADGSSNGRSGPSFICQPRLVARRTMILNFPCVTPSLYLWLAVKAWGRGANLCGAAASNRSVSCAHGRLGSCG